MSTPTIAEATSGRLRFITAQPANESLARVFLGASIYNRAGESLGDISDLMFDKTGRISAVVLAIGGLLGMGEKFVAVPFNTLSMTTGADGTRTITMKVSREAVKSAPAFIPMDKSALDAVQADPLDVSQTKAGEVIRSSDEASGMIGDRT